MKYRSQEIVSRHGIFLFGMLVSVITFYRPLAALLGFSLKHEFASHIALIPLISVYLIYLQRANIFQKARYSYRLGVCLVLCGMLLYWLAVSYSTALGHNDSLPATTFAIVVVWLDIFVLCYGTESFRAALFPLVFLFLMVPIPSAALERVIALLQRGSTDSSQILFQLLGVPVFRHGTILSLPTINIEVARECSGIRSTLALAITCLIAGYLFLRSSWRRAILILIVIPLSVLKNGIRIVTLSMLGMYVDPGFLHGALHRDGGIVFFLLALMIVAPVLYVLKKSEKAESKGLISHVVPFHHVSPRVSVNEHH